MRQRTHPIDRFVTKVEFTDDCWLWNGARNPRGYGNFLNQDGRMITAHRFAYSAFVEVIPSDMVVDHLCRNHACVNPDHLEPVSQRTNLMRGESPSAIAAVATHCPQGHPYDATNTYVNPTSGHRSCKDCRRARDARRYRIEEGAA